VSPSGSVLCALVDLWYLARRDLQSEQAPVWTEIAVGIKLSSKKTAWPPKRTSICLEGSRKNAGASKEAPVYRASSSRTSGRNSGDLDPRSRSGEL